MFLFSKINCNIITTQIRNMTQFCHLHKKHMSCVLCLSCFTMLTWQTNYLGQVCNICLHSDDLHLVVDMDSQAKISDTGSDSASDISTEIILGTTQSSLDKKQTVLQNKLSIAKDHIKIELESKTQMCSSGNLLCASAFNQPWLDLVKDLISK